MGVGSGLMSSKIVIRAGSPEVMGAGDLALALTQSSTWESGLPSPSEQPSGTGSEMCVQLWEERVYFTSQVTVHYPEKSRQEPEGGNHSRDHERMLLTVLLLTACSGCLHIVSRTNSPQMALLIVR